MIEAAAKSLSQSRSQKKDRNDGLVVLVVLVGLLPPLLVR